MANAINWFEIPATNFQRAKDFYAKIFDTTLFVVEMAGTQMAMFQSANTEVGGAICTGEGYAPSQAGTLAYLNGGDDLSIVLNKVENAGGTIVVPKTKISDMNGFFAHFIDCEGNKIALHSMG